MVDGVMYVDLDLDIYCLYAVLNGASVRSLPYTEGSLLGALLFRVMCMPELSTETDCMVRTSLIVSSCSIK